MANNLPRIPLERCADDILCHRNTEQPPKDLQDEPTGRFAECDVKLNPSRIKIFYCKNDDRRGLYLEQETDLLACIFVPTGRRSLEQLLRQFRYRVW